MSILIVLNSLIVVALLYIVAVVAKDAFTTRGAKLQDAVRQSQTQSWARPSN